MAIEVFLSLALPAKRHKPASAPAALRARTPSASLRASAVRGAHSSGGRPVQNATSGQGQTRPLAAHTQAYFLLHGPPLRSGPSTPLRAVLFWRAASARPLQAVAGFPPALAPWRAKTLPHQHATLCACGHGRRAAKRQPGGASGSQAPRSPSALGAHTGSAAPPTSAPLPVAAVSGPPAF